MPDTRIRAPELPDTLQWINTDHRLKLSSLRGKIVLLEFWTSGCINCMHTQPDIRELETKYRDNLVVIGIHSPKFPHNNNKNNVQQAVNRFHFKHPIAHDPDMRVWTKYKVKAWPTVVLIDAEGFVIGSLRGEGRRRQLDAIIQKYIEDGEKKGLMNYDPVPLVNKPEVQSVLKFPGRIHAAANYIYISDSGHNRVVEVNQHGRVTRSFGSGAAGLLDGVDRESAFNNPQGILEINDFLYVADTGNHAIRRVNLGSGEVLTIAGDGHQGAMKEKHVVDPNTVSLNSPWGLCYKDGLLFISMAGSHQIWSLDLADNTFAFVSGSGREELVDGSAHTAALAQPSGLCAGEYCIYMADAESSSIRSVRLPDGQVTTLIGKGMSSFGNIDGGWSHARLQHPMDVSYNVNNGILYVADTYNDCIKAIDFSSKGIETINAGQGLNEPSGLSLSGQTLWIANTNAHEVRTLNLMNHEVKVIEINEPESDF